MAEGRAVLQYMCHRCREIGTVEYNPVYNPGKQGGNTERAFAIGGDSIRDKEMQLWLKPLCFREQALMLAKVF